MDFLAIFATLVLLPILLGGTFSGKGAARKISFCVGIAIVLMDVIFIFYILRESSNLPFIITGYLFRLCILFLTAAVFFCILFGRGKFKKWSLFAGGILFAALFINLLYFL